MLNQTRSEYILQSKYLTFQNPVAWLNQIGQEKNFIILFL